MSQLGNVYVNDAFGTAHRAHSSVVGINHKYRVAGLLMEKELKYLGGFLEKPKKPVLVIMGGAKVADKVNLLKNLINMADEIIIAGGMKNPFFREIHKVNLGKSMLFMPDDPKVLHEIVEYAKEKNCKFHLPIDFILGKELEPGTETMYWEDSFKDVPADFRALDLGPKSAKLFD